VTCAAVAVQDVREAVVGCGEAVLDRLRVGARGPDLVVGAAVEQDRFVDLFDGDVSRRVLDSESFRKRAGMEKLGAQVTPSGEGMAERVRKLAGGPVDLVFDAPPPHAGSIAELISLTKEPSRVMTISNHDEARSLGARVNLDHLAETAPGTSLMPEYASLTASGDFRIPIARTYPLTEWRDAVKLSMSGHPHGKVVLLP
jgi:NADPH:quinone reductase-like Zn-dependent oxidoreductase